MPETTPFDLIRIDVGGHPTLVVYGEVDVLTSPRLHEALEEVIAEGPSLLLLDLANVTFIDSTGLSALVVAHRHLGGAGGELRLVSVPKAVAQLFAVAGLDARFKIYPSVEHATEGAPPAR
jgi:anti-anti-sigma factor